MFSLNFLDCAVILAELMNMSKIVLHLVHSF